MNGKIISLFLSIGLFFLIGLLINPVFATGTDMDSASLKATLVNQDPNPAEPGSYLDLRFRVDKYGNNSMENVSFHLETEYPFSFDGSDTPDRNLGDIANISGDKWYYTLNYKLKVDNAAVKDTYTLKLRYKFNDLNISGLYEFNIDVGDSKNPEFAIGNIVSSPTRLVSDTDEAQLNIDISNIGDEAAENVVAHIAFPQGFTATYSYSDRANLGTISAGSSKTATYYVDIDKSVEVKSYSVPVTITYKESDDTDNEYKTKVINLEIPIKEKPNFKIIYLTTNPEVIGPGDKVKLTVGIKNIGKDADSVSLKIYKESSQPFTFNEKTDYVGNLDKDAEGNAVISFDVDKDAQIKKYVLDLEIRSIDGDEVITQNESITINVEKKQSSSIIFYIVSVIVIALAVGAYFYFKSTKETKDKKKK